MREFDQREGWGGGFTSCAHWLNWRTGLALGAAREQVRVARALGDLPFLSAAMRRADALGLVAESALHAELDGGTTGDRYQVVVHVDEEVLTDSTNTGC